MNKLLSFNPEPFETEAELEGTLQGYGTAGEGEFEGGRSRRRPSYSRPKPVRAQRASGIAARQQPLLKKPAMVKPAWGKQPGMGTRLPIFPMKPFPPFPIVPLPYFRFPTFPIGLPPLSPFWPPPYPDRPWEKPEPRGSAGGGQPGGEPAAGLPPEPEPSDLPSGHVSWVQDCLNRFLGLRLPPDGIMSPATRSAVRMFQERRGLPMTGLVGPETERALAETCQAASLPPPAAFAQPTGPGQAAEAGWEYGEAIQIGDKAPSGRGAGLSVPASPGTGLVPKLLKQESSPPGTTFYVNIDLGIVDKSGIAAAPLTGIFIPAGYVPGAAVDVILYLHGHKPGNNRRLAIDQYWDSRLFPYGAFREGVNASGRNVILVAPTLGSHSEAGSLVTPGGLDAYLVQVLAGLRAYGPHRRMDATPSLGNLILACHSGGGRPMRQLAGSRRGLALPHIRECWGFDCTYNHGDDTFWAEWAQARPNSRVYIHYIAGSKTAPLAENLRRMGVPNATVRPSKEGRHNYVPIAHWQERLQAANFLRLRAKGLTATTMPQPSDSKRLPLYEIDSIRV